MNQSPDGARTEPSKVLGAIIAGGRSARFGSDKALAEVAGRPMIAQVAAALDPWVDALVVCGRKYHGLAALADRPAPDLGPLGGFAAALHHADAQGFDAVVTFPCDTPVVDSALLPELIGTHAPAYLADCPVIGIWPATLATALDRFLATDDRRAVRTWASAIGARALPWSAPANINRPQDLAMLAADQSVSVNALSDPVADDGPIHSLKSPASDP